MDFKKLLRLVPYIILSACICYTMITLWTKGSPINNKQILASLFILINLFLYLKKYDYGLVCTGVILLLCSFALISVFPQTVYSSYTIKFSDFKLSTPNIQVASLFIFSGYLLINGGYLIELYADYKYRRNK